MRRFLIVLPVIAVAAASLAAVVVSAGPSGAGGGTTGYTVYFPSSVPNPNDAGTNLAPAFDPSAAGDVGAQQGSCFGQLATVDLASGAVTPLAAPPSHEACVGDLAFGPDGTLYGLVLTDAGGGPGAELVRFDLTSGAATAIGTFGPFQYSYGGAGEGGIGGIAFDATGTLYAVLGGADEAGYDSSCAPSGSTGFTFCLYRVADPNVPGNATFVGRTFDAGRFAELLAARCDGMFSASYELDGSQSDSSEVDAVSTGDGASQAIGNLADGRFLLGADFDGSGTFWGVVYDNAINTGSRFSLATLDPAGGDPIDTAGPTMTVEGDDDPFFDGLAIQPLDCAQPAPIVIQPTFTG